MLPFSRSTGEDDDDVELHVLVPVDGFGHFDGRDDKHSATTAEYAIAVLTRRVLDPRSERNSAVDANIQAKTIYRELLSLNYHIRSLTVNQNNNLLIVALHLSTQLMDFANG